MVISFDKFNNTEQPQLILCNPRCTYDSVTGTLSHVVGLISSARDIEIIYRFNSPSELSFTAYKQDLMFPCIQNRRLVFVDNVGFYYITEVVAEETANGVQKRVSAQSCDIDLMRMIVPFIDTEAAYSLSDCLDFIRSDFPDWNFPDSSDGSTNPIPEEIASKMRVFEDIDSNMNVYTFIIQELQKAFNCVFEVDYITRTVTCYDASTYVEEALAYVPGDGLADSISISRTSEDVRTALTVRGGNDLNVIQCNPLGTSTIYDFSYFYDNMSPELFREVTGWQRAISDAEEIYGLLNADLAEKTDEIVTLESAVVELEAVIDTYGACMDNITAGSSASLSIEDIGDGYNDTLSELGETSIDFTAERDDLISSISDKIKAAINTKSGIEADISNLNDICDSIKGQIKDISSDLAIDRYFTPEQAAELSSYIIEGNWDYEYATQTDSMDAVKRAEQSKVLYDAAKEHLSLLNSPIVELNADMRAFAFLKEYKRLTDSISIGRNKIDLAVNGGNTIYSLFLTEICTNYEDKHFGLSFANRPYKSDNHALYTDLFGEISRSANTVTKEANAVYPVVGARLNNLRLASQNALNISLKQALSSQNNVVTIDSSGYLGTTISDDVTSDEQIKITNNAIVFTENAWSVSGDSNAGTGDTAGPASLAIGPISTGAGNSVYGINAKLILGQIIAGVSMQIGSPGETESLGGILGGMETKLEEYEDDVGQDGNWLTFDDVSGLTIGKKLKNSDGTAFYSVQKGSEYRLCTTASPTTPIVHITAVDAKLKARSAETVDKMSLGGCDFIALDNGMAVKWRE